MKCVLCGTNITKERYHLDDGVCCKKCYDKKKYLKDKIKIATEKFSEERAFAFAKRCALKRKKRMVSLYWGISMFDE